MKNERIIRACIIFLFGFLSASIISYVMVYGTEIPISDGIVLFENSSAMAPSDFIKENQIEIFEDKVVIHIKGASLSKYAPTGSMIPVFDENGNGIRIIPKSEEEINLGDIITYSDGKNLIVHRIVEKGKDEEGIFFITKGDNNFIRDKKIRFNNIKYKTVGVIW